MHKFFIALLLIVFVLLIAGCNLGNTYIFTMDYPEKSSHDYPNVYETESFYIQFTKVTNQIEFTLKNKTESPLKIIWDNCVYIGLDGKTSRIAHWGVKYADLDKSMVPTVIPPEITIKEGIIPSNNVEWGFRSWVVSYIISPTLEIDGQKFSLYLCLEINGHEEYFNFKFTIHKTSSSILSQSDDSEDVVYNALINNGMPVELTDKLPNASYKQGCFDKWQ